MGQKSTKKFHGCQCNASSTCKTCYPCDLNVDKNRKHYPKQSCIWKTNEGHSIRDCYQQKYKENHPEDI